MLIRMAGRIEGRDLPGPYREWWMGRRKPSAAEAMAEMER
jgi:hypothetical protein